MRVCVFSLCAHDSESFDVFWTQFVLAGQFIMSPSSQGEEAQHTNLTTSLQDAVVGKLSEYPGFMGCKTSCGLHSTSLLPDLGREVRGSAIVVLFVWFFFGAGRISA